MHVDQSLWDLNLGPHFTQQAKPLSLMILYWTENSLRQYFELDKTAYFMYTKETQKATEARIHVLRKLSISKYVAPLCPPQYLEKVA